MIGNISDVKIISSFKNKSSPYKKIQSRTTHGLIFRLEGFAEYSVNGEIFRANKGDVAFLPKGTCYDFISNNSTYTSINFEANIENPQIAIYSLKDYVGAYSMFQRFSETWNFGNQSDKYKCLSDFYDLLSYISRIEHFNSAERENYRILEPALKYLRSHIYDSELKIESLHHLCGISDTYFRKIFTARFAMTPQKYVTKERLARARLIIESGDYDTLRTVSESVGYVDPLYFSKAFRKQYGFSPSAVCD